MGGTRNFDDTNDSVIINSYSSIDNIFHSTGSISCWIYPRSGGGDGFSTFGRIFDKTTGTSVNPTAGWFFSTRDGSSTIDLQFAIRYGNLYSMRTSNTISANNWYYLTLTYDGSSTSNIPRIYQNGVLQTASPISSPVGTPASDSSLNLYFGFNANSDRPFDGYICYCQMWTKIISTSEMLESMYKPGSIRDNLVGFWPLVGNDPETNLFNGAADGTVSGSIGINNGPAVTYFG